MSSRHERRAPVAMATRHLAFAALLDLEYQRQKTADDRDVSKERSPGFVRRFPAVTADTLGRIVGIHLLRFGGKLAVRNV